MVALEQKSSPCYKICIRGWEDKLKETLLEQTQYFFSTSQIMLFNLLSTFYQPLIYSLISPFSLYIGTTLEIASFEK
ncbi:hypothetical protein BpHYR1_006694 [Brachionus plicatilis]|uniref:Uncharacterized protein n=1 Tax=Brachionus plicatilis TaxID=10195 RepID=A0A3M7RU29_BRAPC|nr:hypothetical protein BpHYR1_006694 [Brachionus plicatilis]